MSTSAKLNESKEKCKENFYNSIYFILHMDTYYNLKYIIIQKLKLLYRKNIDYIDKLNRRQLIASPLSCLRFSDSDKQMIGIPCITYFVKSKKRYHRSRKSYERSREIFEKRSKKR